MIRNCLSALVGLALLAGTAVGQSTDADADLYRVAVLAAIPSLSAADRVAMADTTVDISGAWKDAGLAPDHPYLHPRTRITYAKPETVEAFLAASANRVLLPDALRSAPELFLVNQKTLEQIRASRQSDRIVRRNRLRPGSEVSVSAIGFDSARSEALLYVSYTCGSLCGHTTFVLLKRDDGGWRVAKLDQYSES